MRKADVVIGAGYGDEGKGLMTDFLASQYDESIVIRFNGGAQAGHTVRTNDKVHVFSHFGSGTFANAHTYLSEFFIVNPIVFMSEGAVLEKMIKPPAVTIHPDAPVTTPYDMLINQAMAKNNSCGMGIWETTCRHPYFPLRAADLRLSKAQLRAKLIDIRDNYIPNRLTVLGFTLPEVYQEALMSENIMEAYLHDCGGLAGYVTIGRLKPTNIPIIFEGAQGLLLDKDFDPEGTPTNTGLTNVIPIARSLDINQLHVNYMIRAYMTRHGSGSFPTENPAMQYEDVTNVLNKYQGPLRQGVFDYDLVGEAVTADRDHNTGWIDTKTRLVVTHLDQMPAYIEAKVENEIKVYSREHFASNMARGMRVNDYAESWGPTRKDIKCLTPFE